MDREDEASIDVRPGPPGTQARQDEQQAHYRQSVLKGINGYKDAEVEQMSEEDASLLLPADVSETSTQLKM